MQYALPLIDDTLFIDNSTYEVVDTCERAAQYKFLGKKEKSGERPALKFGGILHKVLEAKYHNLHEPVDIQTSLMQVAAQKGFEKYTPPDDDYRNLDKAFKVIEKYQKEYASEPFDILRNTDGEKLIEVPFAVPFGTYTFNRTLWVRNPDGTFVFRHVGTIQIMFTGRIDLFLTVNGKHSIMDHKTTSMMGPSYFKEFETSSQFRAYPWACEQLGFPIETVIINALGIRPYTKTGKEFDFQRTHIFVSPQHTEEWKQSVETKLHTFFDRIGGFHPMTPKYCVNKYGTCEFFDVCTLPKNQRDMMLSTGEFKDVKWDPLNPEQE